jgi:hypothetical protein
MKASSAGQRVAMRSAPPWSMVVRPIIGIPSSRAMKATAAASLRRSVGEIR